MAHFKEVLKGSFSSYHKGMRLLTFFVTIIFGVSNTLGLLPPVMAQEVPAGPVSHFFGNKASPFHIPNELGEIEYFFASPKAVAPLIIHIQSAHGIYEAEKNTQALLGYLNEKYKSNTLFLEGGAGELHPELFNLFPGRPDMNLKIADSLVKRAEMSGPEVFLIEKMDRNIRAYGIEDIQAYQKNRKVFQQVLRQKEKTKTFLLDMNLQIERLSSPYLNPALKNFLKVLEDFEAEKINLAPFLHFLKEEAQRRLEIDLDDPFYQKDWPMLIRFFRMKKLEPKLNPAWIEKERAEFLEQLASLKVSPELIKQLESIFSAKSPRPETRRVFEYLFEVLPENFSFRAYENLKNDIQFLVLQSELRGDILFQETDRLKEMISEKLAPTEIERKLLSLFQDFRLLKKLFSLELSRSDYDLLRNRLRPSEIADRFLKMNKEKRVRDIGFKHLDEVDRLYDLAYSFYQGAEEREGLMGKNVLERMKSFDEKPVILVTGGFHSQGMKDYFVAKGFSYCLVTPRITQTAESKGYHLAMLEANKSPFALSQIANILKLQPIQQMIRQGANPNYLRTQLLQALRDAGVDGASLTSANHELFSRQYQLHFRFLPITPKVLRSEVRSPTVQISDLSSILDSLKDKDPKIREEALITLNDLVITNPSLRNLEVYKAEKETVKDTLLSYLNFIKPVIETPRALIDKLVTLEVGIVSLDGQKETRFATSNILKLVDWVIQNRTGRGMEHLRVIVNYDTGSFVSQVERGRFIALFLYLENSARSPTFFSLGPVSPNADPHESYGHFFQRYRIGGERNLSYLFRLSTAVVETEETLESKESLRTRVYDRLEQVQLLNLGLLLASAEDSYKVFFPGESPFGNDVKLKLIAQLYRAFERRFVSFLREYNRFRNPDSILSLKEAPQIYQERRKAFENYFLEEALFPFYSWLYPVKDSQDRLLPLFRAIEGMELQDDLSKTLWDIESNFVVGREFVERSAEIGDEFQRAMKRILSNKLLTSNEFTSEFLEAFDDAAKFFDPFMDTRTTENKMATLHYLEKVVEGLNQKLISPAELPVPFFNYRMAHEVLRQELEQTARSEMRNGTRLEPLKEILKKLDRGDRHLEEAALKDLAYLLEANPSLRESDPYANKMNQSLIKKALVRHLPFVRTVLTEIPTKSLEELIPLSAEISRWGYEGRRTPFSTSNVNDLVDWVLKNRILKGEHMLQAAQMIRVFIPYDTGVLPSQIERGRFIALFLYLENSVYDPTYYSLNFESSENLFQRHVGPSGRSLSYWFRLSSAIRETKKAIQTERFRKHLKNRFDQIQWLNLGMLLASAEDSFRVFFPKETPFWMNEEMITIAQAYRAFERRLISFLREYNRFRDADNIFRLQEPIEFHLERRLASSNYLLEEILSHDISWLFPSPRHETPLEDILPFLRGFEAMQLNKKAGTVYVSGGHLLLGRQFMEGVTEIGNEYLIAFSRILSKKSPLFHEISNEFLRAFEEAEKYDQEEFRDPLIDLTNYKGYTEHYLQRVRAALGHGILSYAQLPDPRAFKEAEQKILDEKARLHTPRGRSEIRKRAEVSETIARMAVKFMNGIIAYDTPAFSEIFNLIFRDRIRREAKQDFMQDRIRRKGGDSFGLISIPVSQGVTRRELVKILREFRPILKNHPKKMIVFTDAGKLSERLIHQLHEKFDRRVFIFEGNHEQILKGLYSSNGDFSKWSKQNKEWVTKHFLPRANQLLGQTAKPGILSRSSFAIGNEALFNEMGISPAKQLLDQAVDGVRRDELLRAYLLFGLSYAALPNAVLLKEAPSDLFQFENQPRGDFLRFSLNSSKAREIQALIRAAQKLLQAA